MFNNKAAGSLPTFKVIVIILMISIIFVWAAFMLLTTKGVYINTKIINSQIVVSKILNNNCFSLKYGLINQKDYSFKSLNKCIAKINQVSIRIYLNKNPSTLIYYPSKTDFNTRSVACSILIKSNTKCFTYEFPIIYNSLKNIKSLKILHLNIISYT